MSMGIALGATWHPRGELTRFQAILTRLRSAYASVYVVLPPGHAPAAFQQEAGMATVDFSAAEDWSWGRYLAVEAAFQSGQDFLHYADLDRLIRWVETYPEEWQAALGLTTDVDCLVVGRTEQAYRTHPDALRLTEGLSNQVISHLLGFKVDVSAGVKSFSRAAARFLLGNCQPGHALGTDGEWPVLLHRAGFGVQMMWTNGLDWESADRYLQGPADPAAQRQASQAYDMDPAHWSYRVGVAAEIIHWGLSAYQRPFTHDDDQGIGAA